MGEFSKLSKYHTIFQKVFSINRKKLRVCLFIQIYVLGLNLTDKVSSELENTIQEVLHYSFNK